MIYVGDKYRLDYLAPNTVLFIDHSDTDSALIRAAGGIIRNDQQYLQDVAALAYEWYRVDRQPIALTFKHLRDVFRLGMLITTIGDGSTQVTINTMVKYVAMDLLTGRMTIETDGDDLDVVA